MGLLNHFWVFTKLVLTVVVIVTGAVFVNSLVHQALATTTLPDFSNAGSSPVALIATVLVGLYAAHVVLLGTATALSVYKPWGLTPRGQTELAQRRRQGSVPDVPKAWLSTSELESRGR